MKYRIAKNRKSRAEHALRGSDVRLTLEVCLVYIEGVHSGRRGLLRCVGSGLYDLFHRLFYGVRSSAISCPIRLSAASWISSAGASSAGSSVRTFTISSLSRAI